MPHSMTQFKHLHVKTEKERQEGEKEKIIKMLKVRCCSSPHLGSVKTACCKIVQHKSKIELKQSTENESAILIIILKHKCPTSSFSNDRI